MSQVIALSEHETTEGDAVPFADRLLRTFSEAAVAVGISIGHRTGLFDVLSRLPASTSGRIAMAAGLDERYVREWLAAMVSGRVLTYDAKRETYKLPREHAAVLTRVSEENLAITAQWIALVGGVEDEIVRAFREGGGIGYEHYPRFDEVMAEESKQKVVSALFDGVLPLIPGLLDRLEEGIAVLDIGCGQGRALIALASAFPNSRFVGVDCSQEAIHTGTAIASSLGLANLNLILGDAAELDFEDAFDLVTAFDVVHDLARPDRALANVRAALSEGGTFVMQDIAAGSRLADNVNNPLAAFLYTVSYAQCMPVVLERGGEPLGLCWGRETALRMLRGAGFGEVRIETLTHDRINEYFIAPV